MIILCSLMLWYGFAEMTIPHFILTQTIDDVPFDLKHNRCLVYHCTPRGWGELKRNLAKTLQALKQKRPTG